MAAVLLTSPMTTVLSIALHEETLVPVVGAGPRGACITQVAEMAGHRVLLDNRHGENPYRLSLLIQRQVYQGKNIHG